jgi:hypothetical protein
MPEERFLSLQLHELLAFLNQQGIITIMVLAQQGLIGSMQSAVDLTYLADTVVLLRYFEARGELKQAVSVVKKRSGHHERSIREMKVGQGGIQVGPLGVSGDDLLCYANLLPNLVQSTIKETSSTRYGFDGTAPAAAYCHPSLGTRLITSVSAGTAVSTLNARPGDVVAWPCTRVVAFEVDDDGLPLVILQHDGALYSPRPRVP